MSIFCPKCSSLLLPKHKHGKTIMACSCGYESDNPDDAVITEKNKKKVEAIEVVEKEPEIYPKIEAECPKCRHKEAYYWTVQTRAGDEPETKFMKCAKCEHVWRDYS